MAALLPSCPHRKKNAGATTTVIDFHFLSFFFCRFCCRRRSVGCKTSDDRSQERERASKRENSSKCVFLLFLLVLCGTAAGVDGRTAAVVWHCCITSTPIYSLVASTPDSIHTAERKGMICHAHFCLYKIYYNINIRVWTLSLFTL